VFICTVDALPVTQYYIEDRQTSV